ncbi:MAG: FHA domain-containing protein, partial [Clostridia bacterium]|nr:FHA domain-containing protein [Clostridia bacterium]
SDSDSLNGTYLNGDRLTPGAYYRVVNGDVISLAHVSMSFEFCA